MKAKSIKGTTTKAINSELEKSMIGGFSPSLAIAFVSVAQDRVAISKLLDDKGTAVFGCTTHGEFTNEEPQKGSAAILLLDMNPDYLIEHL